MAPSDKPPVIAEETEDGVLGGDYAIGHDQYKPGGLTGWGWYEHGGGPPPTYNPPSITSGNLYDSSDVSSIQNWSQSKLTQLQQWLVASGYLDEGATFTPGHADPATIAAYESLLGDANVLGMTWESALDQKLQSPNAPVNQPTAAPAPMPIALTNTEDLKAMFQNTAWDMLGTELDKDTVDGMVTAWHDQERATASEAIAAERAAADGRAETYEFEQAMGAAGTEEKIKTAVYDIDPAGAEAMGFAKAHDQWLAQLGVPTSIGRQRGGDSIRVRGT